MSTKNKRKTKKIGGKTLGATLCISTSFVLILLGLVVFGGLTANNLSSWVKENLTVSVMFDDIATSQEAEALSKRIATKPYVVNSEYISREQALKEQTEALGTDPSEFLGENPFSPSQELYIKSEYANRDSLEWIEKDLKAEKLVAEVAYQEDLVDSVNSNIHIAMIVMLILAGLLTFISFTLISVTVLLSVYSRRFTINTMQLVGASWSFIRRPFMKVALLQGVASAVIAIAVLSAMGYSLYVIDEEFVVEAFASGVVSWMELLITAASVLVFGVLLSTVCVYFSVNRYLGMPTRRLYN